LAIFGRRRRIGRIIIRPHGVRPSTQRFGR
jgi:hypothetical protein